jgi:hypothetical protein
MARTRCAPLSSQAHSEVEQYQPRCNRGNGVEGTGHPE